MLSDRNIDALIKNSNLITNHNPANLHNSGYSLRVGSVFQPDTGVEEIKPNSGGWGTRDFWIIGPTECLIIKTAEKLNIPDGYSAYYAPLNRLAQKGIMLLNASVVEPGYSGPLSCFLVNFSSQDVEIIKDEDIAKITFHKLDDLVQNFIPKIIDDKKYGIELSKSARLFEKTFLGVSGIEEKACKAATKSVNKSLLFGGLILTFLLVFSQLEPIVSKYLWQSLGVITTSRRVDESNLKFELESSQKELIELRLKIKETDEIADLKESIRLMKIKVDSLERKKIK